MKILDTITSIDKFQQIIVGIRERRAYTQAYGFPYCQEFFRGQLNNNWAIIPSLARDFKTVAALKNAEDKVMDLFKQLVKEKGAENRIFLHDAPQSMPPVRTDRLGLGI